MKPLRFDAILCSFWFWRDPMASTAELLLPTLALHAPLERRPFLAILSDDAHSAKARSGEEWRVGARKGWVSERGKKGEGE